MTLKEIEKIIDESDVVIGKKEEDFGYKLFCIANPADYSRERRRQELIEQLEQGWVMSFYRANPEKMELIHLAKVDHIDKEKKVIKKLDEMTEQEAINLCYKRDGKDCECCPLMFYADEKEKRCLRDYFMLKRSKEMFGDREIEIEVEE